MGDLNAKVASYNMYCHRAIIRHRCGTSNESGERLIDSGIMNNLVIGGILFPHQDIHKVTWCSPSGRDKNHIDHLMISGTWKCSLLALRVKRGVDVGSDHHFVTVSIKL